MEDEVPQLAKRILSELDGVVGGSWTAGAVSAMVQEIAEASRQQKRMFLHGVGREGLMMKALAMRLFHLGLAAHCVGDMTTPPISHGDLLLLSAGPGGFATVDALASLARTAGARILLLTAQPQGSASQLADVVVYMPAQTMADDAPPDCGVGDDDNDDDEDGCRTTPGTTSMPTPGTTSVPQDTGQDVDAPVEELPQPMADGRPHDGGNGHGVRGIIVLPQGTVQDSNPQLLADDTQLLADDTQLLANDTPHDGDGECGTAAMPQGSWQVINPWVEQPDPSAEPPENKADGTPHDGGSDDGCGNTHHRSTNMPPQDTDASVEQPHEENDDVDSGAANLKRSFLPQEHHTDASGKEQSLLPMGSLYEGALFLVFEIVVLKLQKSLGVTSEEMRSRHTNLE